MFDLTQVEEVGGFQPIEAGVYRLTVENAEVKTTKAGTGEYINVTFEITGDKYNKRKLWKMFNIKNPNDVAVKIGLGELKKMITCSSKPKALTFQDPIELCGLVVYGFVGLKEDKNEINYFLEQKDALERIKQQESVKQFSSSISADDIPF